MVPTTTIITLIALLLTTSSALPPGRPPRPSSTPSPNPNTAGGESSRTGSGSSGGNSYCDTILSSREREALLTEIRSGLHGLIDILQIINVWSASEVLIQIIINLIMHDSVKVLI